jgi:hypothetical protein
MSGKRKQRAPQPRLGRFESRHGDLQVPVQEEPGDSEDSEDIHILQLRRELYIRKPQRKNLKKRSAQLIAEPTLVRATLVPVSQLAYAFSHLTCATSPNFTQLGKPEDTGVVVVSQTPDAAALTIEIQGRQVRLDHNTRCPHFITPAVLVET